MSPTFKTVAAQALELPDEERGELAALLMESLDPDEQNLSSDDWNVAWSAEIERRITEIREGRAELVDGEDVLSELRDIADSPQPLTLGSTTHHLTSSRVLGPLPCPRRALGH